MKTAFTATALLAILTAGLAHAAEDASLTHPITIEPIPTKTITARQVNRPQVTGTVTFCHQPNLVNCETFDLTLPQGAVTVDFVLPPDLAGSTKSGELLPNSPGGGFTFEMCFTFAQQSGGQCVDASLGQTIFTDNPVENFTVPPVCTRCFRNE